MMWCLSELDIKRFLAKPGITFRGKICVKYYSYIILKVKHSDIYKICLYVTLYLDVFAIKKYD